MATTVIQGRDPWWAPVAVNILGGLWNDWQQRERNKKENAYIGELQRLYGEMNNGTAQATQPPQDTGQGLLNMDIPEGYNANGWANAFHKTDSPITQFDLGTAGLVPTTGNPTPALPLNAWANAMNNSGNPLPQMNAGTVPTATPQTGRAPIVTPMDFYNAAMQLAGSKRFRMLNADRIQGLLTPYMKINEEARKEQMRDELAGELNNAQDPQSFARMIINGAIRQTIDRNTMSDILNQNKPVTHDLGGSIEFGTNTPWFGYTPQGAFEKSLTPDQVATHDYNDRLLGETIRSHQATENYNREKLALEGMGVSHIQADPDGGIRIFRKNGSTERYGGQGLSEREKAMFNNDTAQLARIDTNIGNLELRLAQWGELLTKATTETEKEIAKQNIERITQEIKEQKRQRAETEGRLRGMLGSGNANGQGQPTAPQGTPEQTTPPVTVIGTPEQVTPPPTSPDVTAPVEPQNTNQNNAQGTQQIEQTGQNDIFLVDSYGRTVTKAEFDEYARKYRLNPAETMRIYASKGYLQPPTWRTPNGRIITYKEFSEMVKDAENGKIQGIRNRADLLRELERRGVTRIDTNQTIPTPQTASPDIIPTSPDVSVTTSPDIVPISPDVIPTSPDVSGNSINTSNQNTANAVNLVGNNTTGLGNLLLDGLASYFGGTPAYADENISGNGEMLASNRNTEAGIQRALDELNGQFGEQRWSDWATGLDLQGIGNKLPEWQTWLNKFNSQANPTPNRPPTTNDFLPSNSNNTPLRYNATGNVPATVPSNPVTPIGGQNTTRQTVTNNNIRQVGSGIDIGANMLGVKRPTITTVFRKARKRKNGTTYYHAGVDYAMPKNHPIRLANIGTTMRVTKIANDPKGYGNYVDAEGILTDKNGKKHTISFRWAHMGNNTINVTQGQEIRYGDLIGRVGNTGNSRGKNGGYHLHLEACIDGKLVDPTKFHDLISQNVLHTSNPVATRTRATRRRRARRRR